MCYLIVCKKYSQKTGKPYYTLKVGNDNYLSKPFFIDINTASVITDIKLKELEDSEPFEIEV